MQSANWRMSEFGLKTRKVFMKQKSMLDSNCDFITRNLSGLSCHDEFTNMQRLCNPPAGGCKAL